MIELNDDVTFELRGDVLRVDSSTQGSLELCPWGPEAGAWEIVEGERRALEGTLELDLAGLEMTHCFSAALDLDSWSDSGDYAGDFLDLIPQRERTLAAKFGPSSWEVLMFLARHGNAALELAESNAALAILLCHGVTIYPTRGRDETSRLPREEIDRLLGERRAAIAQRFGFVAPGAVHVLEKLRPDCFDLNGLNLAAAAQHDPPRWKWLLHLPHITMPVLELLADRDVFPRLRYSFLNELVALDPGDDWNLIHQLKEVRRIERALDIAGPPLRSTGDLDRLHERYVELLNRGSIRLGDEGPFPAPPIPEGGGVKPIETSWELTREGVSQHHCVLSYTPAVQKSECYVYRVLEPERATLRLERIGSLWVLGEIRGFANGEVSPETIERVRTWYVEQYLDRRPSTDLFRAGRAIADQWESSGERVKQCGNWQDCRCLYSVTFPAAPLAEDEQAKQVLRAEELLARFGGELQPGVFRPLIEAIEGNRLFFVLETDAGETLVSRSADRARPFDYWTLATESSWSWRSVDDEVKKWILSSYLRSDYWEPVDADAMPTEREWAGVGMGW